MLHRNIIARQYNPATAVAIKSDMIAELSQNPWFRCGNWYEFYSITVMVGLGFTGPLQMGG